MQVVAYNQQQLDVIIRDMYNDFNEYKSLAISYDKPFKDKTIRQLGYFFGGLVKSVYKFYKAQGIIFEEENIKENFYQACSKIDDSLMKTVTRFNGEVYQVPKRLSEMDLESMSVFIDKCLWLIDNARCFKGLILHPSLRYTWVRHIDKDELFRASQLTYPRNCPEYLAYTRQQACICCGIQNYTQVHHLKEAGQTGTAYKADDWLTIPLCDTCHLKTLHQKGQESFMKNLDWITKYVDIIDFCRLRYIRWLNKL